MKTLQGQSLIDLAIQSSGRASSAFALSVKNNVSLTGEIEPSTTIAAIDVASSPVVSYYEAKGLKPASYAVAESANLAGIGYMTIEQNFTVE